MLPSRLTQPGLLLILILLIVLGVPSIAVAQPSGARGDDFIYRVVPNDTLIDISTRFTGTPNNWGTLQSLNSVFNTLALPIGRELRIPFSLIPEVAAQATVTHSSGQSLLNQGPVRAQDTLTEGDVVETRTDSFVTFQLPDGSIASLPENSVVNIKRLKTFLGTGLIDVILKLQNGGVESTVAPEDTGTGRYEIQTPVSITGVRGTRLRVRADSNGARTEVLSGNAQLGKALADGAQVGPQQGVAVTPEGKILPARPLLPAPTLSIDANNPNFRSIMFDPVPGAASYLVRVASDPEGTRPVWAQTIDAPPAAYRTPGSGTWYVLVRAIDDLGLMGEDAVQPVEGRAVLLSGSGEGVRNGFGDPILLTDY